MKNKFLNNNQDQIFLVELGLINMQLLNNGLKFDRLFKRILDLKLTKLIMQEVLAQIAWLIKRKPQVHHWIYNYTRRGVARGQYSNHSPIL